MAILAALLGSWGRRGGYLVAGEVPAPGVPAARRTCRTTARAATAPTSRRRAATRSPTEVLASGLCDATQPGPRALRPEGLDRLRLQPRAGDAGAAGARSRRSSTSTSSSAVDVLPAEIAGWADVVLPEATYLERDDDVSAPAYKRPFVAIRQAAVEPLYDSKPGWWIAKELANRVGLGAWFPWKDAKEYVRTRLAQKGLSYEELAAKGVLLGAPVPTCEEEGAPVGAATESGKIQLYSKELQALGFDPLPVYTPQEEGPAGLVPAPLRARAAPHLRPDRRTTGSSPSPTPRTRSG